MYKTLIAAATFISLFAFQEAFAQLRSSVQVNGGIVMPFNTSNGFTASAQFNYPINKKKHLYFYTGYTAWGKNSIQYKKEIWSSKDRQENFKTYTEDSHVLIPLYIGEKMILGSGKLFTAYFNFETGYSYFRYNSYTDIAVTDTLSGETRGYTADQNSKRKIREDFFGLGFGTGISSPLTDKIDLVMAFKISTTYTDLFAKRSTFTVLTAGINFGL